MREDAAGKGLRKGVVVNRQGDILAHQIESFEIAFVIEGISGAAAQRHSKAERAADSLPGRDLAALGEMKGRGDQGRRGGEVPAGAGDRDGCARISARWASTPP